MFKKTTPTQAEIARFANVMPTTVRKNVVILLSMVIKDGYTIDKNFVEEFNERLMKKR